MPQAPKRGGGSLLGSTPRSANGGSNHGFEPDLLTELDILYLKNVLLKFIEVRPSPFQKGCCMAAIEHCCIHRWLPRQHRSAVVHALLARVPRQAAATG